MKIFQIDTDLEFAIGRLLSSRLMIQCWVQIRKFAGSQSSAVDYSSIRSQRMISAPQ